MTRISCRCIAVVLAGLGWGSGATAQQQPTPTRNPLVRHYREGETLRYHMTASHESDEGVSRYEADATGRVVRDSAGRWYELLEWSNLVRDGAPVALPTGTPAVQQRLSLSLENTVLPDLAHTDPRLIGPVLDLLTFYVDLLLAERSALARPGDHARVPGRGANSWADGRYVTRGEDAIDFELRLDSVDTANQVAKLLVRHVPPDSGRVALPAPWMEARIGAEPNNWLQVRPERGTFIAGVGRETFDVWLMVSLVDGRILFASMDNPVEVSERTCGDSALTTCGAPSRHTIRRRIALELRP